MREAIEPEQGLYSKDEIISQLQKSISEFAAERDFFMDLNESKSIEIVKLKICLLEIRRAEETDCGSETFITEMIDKCLNGGTYEAT